MRISVVLVAVFVGLTGIGLAWYFYSVAAGTGIDLNNAQQVAHGKTIYARECASCHGKRLEGQTRNWRQRLPDGTIPAPPHDASGHTWHHPDTMLFEITKYGRLKAAPATVRSNMPAFDDKLSDADIWAVLSFVKSQWPTEIRRRHDGLNERYKAAR